MMCSSRAVQVFAYILCFLCAWFAVPLWLMPMSIFWQAVFAWVVGSLCFLLFLALLFAMESMLTHWMGEE